MQRHQRYHIFRLLSRRLRYNTLIGLFLALAPWVSGQETVRGIVKDCHSSNPLAFVNLISADGRWGTSTDIEGRFSLEGVSLPVQLSFTYIGYGPVRIWVNKAEDIAEVMMCPEVLNLSEVVILPWNNPALAMIRKVLENRDRHDPARLDSYACEAYGKMVFTVDTARTGINIEEIPDSTRRKIRELLDRHYLFIMETASERYYRRGRLQERVTGSRIAGLKDPVFVFLISQLQSFSFYENVFRIGERSYLNPVSPTGLRKYYFALQDTLFDGADTTYVIRYQPMPGQGVDAMRGLLFIHGSDWAIQKVTAEPAEETSGMSISIRQKYERVEGRWFPVELGSTLLLRNVTLGPFFAQGDGNYYLRNIRLDGARVRSSGLMSGLEVLPDAHKRDSVFWASKRVARLDAKELATYHAIDSIGREEKLDLVVRRLDALTRGRYPMGSIDLDLRKLLRYSDYEGIYAGVGLATNERAVPAFGLSAYAGYGYGDDDIKYGGSFRLPVWRPLQLEVLLSAASDLREGATTWDPTLPGTGNDLNFRRLLIRWMDPVEFVQGGLSFRPLRDLKVGLSYTSEVIDMSDAPLPPPSTGLVKRQLATLELRYAIGERMLLAPGRQVSLGTRLPVFWFRWQQAWKAVAGAEVPFGSLEFKMQMSFNMPLTGRLETRLYGGWQSPGQAYSLLFNGRGTYRPFTLHVPNSFATARTNEFAGDRFVYLFLTHDFRHLLTGHRNLPGLRVHFNGGWSRVRKGVALPEQTSDMRKVYLESGLDIPDLIDLGLVQLGIGAYYRLGAHSLPETKENLATKFVLSVPF